MKIKTLIAVTAALAFFTRLVSAIFRISLMRKA